MNKCRECGCVIPDRFNGGPALRCSECRLQKDKEFNEFKKELVSENEKLRSLCKDLTNENFESNQELIDIKRDYLSLKQKYTLLRQQHTVLLNENARLEKENRKLGKGVERLFVKINELDGNSAQKEAFIS